MKKFLALFIGIISLAAFTGCELISSTGEYNEGTYFGYDEESGYTAVVYVSTKGEIESVFIDAPYLKTDDEGEKYATTKQTLADDYGMAKTEDQYEWYEQADLFAEKIVEENGLDWIEWAEGSEEDLAADVLSGVTVSVDGMYNAVIMALEEAK